MPKKPALSPEDKALFQAAIRGIKPLTHTKISQQQQSAAHKQKIQRNEDEKTTFHFSDWDTLPPVEREEKLFFAQPSLPHKILRKLQRGQYNVDAILDLHGMSVETARYALSEFLMQCLAKKIRCLLIIHGKGHGGGKPILKNKLNHWLRQTTEILAFCSALPKQGSRGAVYVLLKQYSEEIDR